MNYQECENKIIENYNEYYDKHEDWFIFMNDGYCPLDENGYPKDFDNIVLTEKYKIWKYQVYLYKVLLESIGVNILDDSSSNKVLLDVGCGRSGGISFFNDYYKFKKLIGIDLNKNHIDLSKKHIKDKHVKLIQSSAINIPLKDNSIDIITCVESSPYYQPFEKYVDEVYRILKDDGIYVRAERYVQNPDMFLNHKFVEIKSLIIENNTRMSCSICKWSMFNTSFKLGKIFYNDELDYINGKSLYNIKAYKKIH